MTGLKIRAIFNICCEVMVNIANCDAFAWADRLWPLALNAWMSLSH